MRSAGAVQGGDVAETSSSDHAEILIVDDFEPNLVALEAVLEPLGHRLIRASSGDQALKHILEHDFALVLLDVMMPELDGYQTAALIRSRLRSRDTPIIFLSAVSHSHTDLMKGYAHGAVDYIVKPFDADILRAKVGVFVELHRSREQIKRQAKILAANDRERLDMEAQVREARIARGQAEAKESAYRFLAESIPQQVWASGPDGGLDYVNPVVESYFGQPAAAILGAGWLAVLHPEDAPVAVERWTRSLQSGAPYEIEFRLRRADGVYRWHLGRAVAERDPVGHVVRWFGTNTDIDDRRAVEAALHTNVQHRDDLLATVSHDLRDPLGAIVLGANMLRRSTIDREAILRTADRIERSATRMEQLVSDLLDLSSIERGQLSITPELCQAQELVDEVAAMVIPRAATQEIRVEVQCRAPAAVRCDRRRILQVFANLTTNAMKFLDKGGSLTIEARRDADLVIFAVTDTGIGIKPEELPHIFDRFWKSQDAKKGGTGLGLAICKGIVEQHGGRIWAESTLGVGTTVAFALPAAP